MSWRAYCTGSWSAYQRHSLSFCPWHISVAIEKKLPSSFWWADVCLLFKPQRQAFANVPTLCLRVRGHPKSCDPSDPLRNNWMTAPSAGPSTSVEVELNPCCSMYSHLKRSLVWNSAYQKNNNKIPGNYVQLCSFFWWIKFHYNWLLKPGFWRECDVGGKFLMSRDADVLRNQDWCGLGTSPLA